MKVLQSLSENVAVMLSLRLYIIVDLMHMVSIFKFSLRI